jgi:hypothetical protein
MQKTIRLFMLSAATFLLSSVAQAAVSPLGLAIIPPAQFPPSDFSVTGLRLSVLYGHHRDMYGIDLAALGNITDQTFVGIAIAGGANVHYGMTTIVGLAVAGGVNYMKEKTGVYGLQVAGLVNWMDAESSVNGFQISLLGNVAAYSTVRGAQIGLYNRAKNVYGLQIGLVNDTDNLYGIQIGLANFHRTGLFYVSPLINIGF